MSASVVRRYGPYRYARAARFARPEPTSALEPAPAVQCPQLPSRLQPVLGPQSPLAASEDCLHLTVTTPRRDDAARPVMVWLHGGAFVTGAGLLDWFDAARLVTGGDVVVVAVNYRLGPFGFLHADSLSPGNLGIDDQIAALRWVQRHIGEFGGDPCNVTLFGQSAGALSTVLLLASEEAQPLFHKAIVQSAPAADLPSPDRGAEIGERFLLELDDDPLAASPDQLLRAAEATASSSTATSPRELGFVPIAGVCPVPAEPLAALAATAAGRPVLYGWATQEGTAFGADDPAPLTASAFVEPGRDLGRRLIAAGGLAFSYEINWRPADSPFGATHCIELPLLFGTEQAWASAPMLGSTPWEEVERIGAQLRHAWTTFAHKGTPSRLSSTAISLKL